MSEIIGVRFKEGGKIYYFRPNEEELEPGCHVIVETVRGTECGEVVMDRREIDDSEFTREVKSIIRKANDADLARLKENRIKAKKAFDICNQKIKAHGLEMNLLEVECTFDNSKIVFNFSAEGRVDFRELVKDLASVFRARIELRQIGVRDEAKMLGGLGVCGRPFCCKQFMGDFQSVSIKMAKEQGLSLNPVKISGTCGRLMCCLKHEQDAYEDLMRTMPQLGSTIMTPDGSGVVVDRELIAGRVKVRLEGADEAPPKTYRVADLNQSEEKQTPVRSHEERHEKSRKSDSRPEPAKKSDKKTEPVRKFETDKKPETPEKGESKQNTAQKPVFNYADIDFEESLSGSATACENPEDDNRSRRQNNSRRPGRRPDRRNQGHKGGGKPPENREEKREAHGEEKPFNGGGQKGGHSRPRRSRSRSNSNNKKNDGKAQDHSQAQTPSDS